MLLLAVKSKKATFDVIAITAATQLRGRDMEGFCDSTYPTTTPSPQNSLDGKVPRRTLKKCVRDAEE